MLIAIHNTTTTIKFVFKESYTKLLLAYFT